MSDTYASVADVGDRLDWQLDADDLRTAAAALEDASDDARFYGRDWPADSAPRLVRRLVVKAVVRYMRNPEGYNQSRSGDETVTWADDADGSPGSPEFTLDEQTQLAELAGRGKGGLIATPTSPYGRVRRTHRVDGLNHRLPDADGNWERRDPFGDNPGLVPVNDGSGAWFPMFAEGDDH